MTRAPLDHIAAIGNFLGILASGGLLSDAAFQRFIRFYIVAMPSMHAARG